ncbi:fasciclin-2-like isoform X2, partial [Leptotrombidium deliense]
PKLISYENISVVEGSKAILECKFSGVPLPKLRIRKDKVSPTQWMITDGKHEVVQQNGTMETTLKVTINNLNRNDAGLYFCVADNGVGGEVTHAGRLDVEYKPDLSKTQQKEVTWNKQPVNLTCVVDAVPNVNDVTWYRSSDQIDENDHFKFFKEPLQGYFKLKVTPMDSTFYT